MDDLLQWSQVHARNAAIGEQKGRDALTESIGQQKAYRSGASFTEGLTAGSRFVEEQKDPMFEIKKKSADLQVAQQSANLADKWREMDLEKQRVDYEQDDYNNLAKVTLDAGGDVDKLISGLGSLTTRSAKFGLQVHQKMSDLVNFQNKNLTTKNEAQMTKGLNDLISKGVDTDIGQEAAQLNVDYQANGWTPENIAKYANIAVRNNRAISAGKAVAGTSGRSPQDVALLAAAEKYEAAGNMKDGAILRAIVEKHSVQTPQVAGTVTETDPLTGRKLVTKLSPEQLKETPPVLDSETQSMLQDYKAEKDEIASGDTRNWYGSSRQKAMDALRVKIIAKGIDPDTGMKINPAHDPTVVKQFNSAEDVRDAFKAGDIDRKAAKKILSEQFNMK